MTKADREKRRRRSGRGRAGQGRGRSESKWRNGLKEKAHGCHGMDDVER